MRSRSFALAGIADTPTRNVRETRRIATCARCGSAFAASARSPIERNGLDRLGGPREGAAPRLVTALIKG
jgi:hypothetical protein